MKRLRWLAAAGLVIPAAATAAWGMWTAEISPGSHGAAVAAEVEAGQQPSASVDGSAVTVRWAPATLNDRSPVTAYVVTRTTVSGETATTGAGCSGLITGTACTETVPDGTWHYSVTPAVGTHWRGPASPVSDPVVVDTTGPAGGSVRVLGLGGTGATYSTSTTLTLRLDPGSDPNGVATGAELRRAQAPLSGGICGQYGEPAAVLTDPPASPADDVLATGRCYRYEYVVRDTFGNPATYTSNVAAVDTTAPTTPALTLTAGKDAAVPAETPTTLHYRPGAAASFTVQATSTDIDSGVAAYAFPSVPGWDRAQSGSSATYSWRGPAADGSQPVRAANKAGTSSATASFTLVADTSPPAGGSVDYRDGFTTASRIAVGLGRGTDVGSGIGKRVLERSVAPLVDGACGTFGPFQVAVNGENPPEPRLDPVDPGFCYQYRYLVVDRVGNATTFTSPAVARVPYSDYATNVRSTDGLSSYWRLGEPTMVLDTFTGSAGAAVQDRLPEVGAQWAKHSLSASDASLTAQGRVRRTVPLAAYHAAVYFSSLYQDTTDYTVEADLYYASPLANDLVALAARLDGVTASGYGAGYDQATQSWQIGRVYGGAKTVLVSRPQQLVPGTSYHLALDMKGATIRLLVDGQEVLTTVDPNIQRGTGGFLLGLANAYSAAPTDTTGMHLDNFRITPALRSAGPRSEPGHYLGWSPLGAPGAALADEDTAARFDGVSDEARVTAILADELSVELWFSSSHGDGAGGTWRDAAGLLATDDLGIGLAGDGSVVAGTGPATLRSPTGFDDASWHHVVLSRAAGRLRLYVDGAEVATAEAPTSTPVPFAPVVLGRGPGGRYAGLLDEVAVYTAALAPETVQLHHAVALGTP